ncbi:MAG: hypothetical protein HXL38_003005 [Candidatus Saccharimonas sp.]|nr:MAG: hypothetical protein HXL38_003005 [Candidatus Saccharimonas sp.]
MKNKLANFQKKFGFLAILIIGGFLVLFQFSKIVFAEEVAKEKPTEIQISKISKKCNDLKNNLKKLRSEDALKRVNLGKSYEKISNGLMSNFNARIALNKKNGAELILIASEFEENFRYFKENFQIYERELSELVSQDCIKNPREFYLKLEKIRRARREVNYNTKKLNEIAEKYGVQVHDFVVKNTSGVLNE